jgi:hypothetical protein
MANYYNEFCRGLAKIWGIQLYIGGGGFFLEICSFSWPSASIHNIFGG